jgi:hypothetical protein
MQQATTDWDAVKQLAAKSHEIYDSNKGYKIKWSMHAKHNINQCVVDKLVFDPNSASESVINEEPIWTYEFNIGNLYPQMHAHDWRLLQNDIKNEVSALYPNRNRMVPWIRAPRIINANTDAIIKCSVHVLGNRVDDIDNRQIYDKLYDYSGITDKSYLPLSCHKYYIISSYYGQINFTIITKTKWENPQLELDYGICLPDEVIINQEGEIDDAVFVETRRDIYNEVSQYDACPDDYTTFNHRLSDYIGSYLPVLRIPRNESTIQTATGMVAIFTTETTNSCIKITLLNRNGNKYGSCVIASSRPGIYELLPVDNNIIDSSTRKVNSKYTLLGFYEFDKPVLAILTHNYIFNTGGMTCLKFVN